MHVRAPRPLAAILLPASPHKSHHRRRFITTRIFATGRAPPAHYDFRTAASNTTEAFITSQCPQLRPLVDQGVLLVVSRPENYVEHRGDGYQEPKHIVLVGTAHVSQQSADAVRQVIQAIKPCNVVVELCRSRSAILQTPPSDGGESLPQALLRSVRLGGGTQVLIRALAARQATQVAKAAGLTQGAEMRAAGAAAEQVDATIVLGDRPIEVTLQRAWRALTWRQKLDLGRAAVQLATSRMEVDAGVVEDMKSDAAVSAFEANLAENFPEVAGPLLHERDAYLAWAMRRSKAVNGAEYVVGVVGFGHLRGITYHLLQDARQLRFKDLVGLTSPLQEKQIRHWSKDLLTGLGWAYTVWWAATTFLHAQ